MMALHRAPAAPAFRVIDGGSPAMRADEARIEVIAFFDEAAAAAERLHVILTGLALDYDDRIRPDLRFRQVLNLVGQVAARADAAKAEVLALTGPEPSAA